MNGTRGTSTPSTSRPFGTDAFGERGAATPGRKPERVRGGGADGWGFRRDPTGRAQPQISLEHDGRDWRESEKLLKLGFALKKGKTGGRRRRSSARVPPDPCQHVLGGHGGEKDTRRWGGCRAGLWGGDLQRFQLRPRRLPQCAGRTAAAPPPQCGSRSCGRRSFRIPARKGQRQHVTVRPGAAIAGRRGEGSRAPPDAAGGARGARGGRLGPSAFDPALCHWKQDQIR